MILTQVTTIQCDDQAEYDMVLASLATASGPPTITQDVPHLTITVEREAGQ